MGIRILEGVKVNEDDATGAVFYDSTSGRAFGPVFEDAEKAESFLSFLEGRDPRTFDWEPNYLAWIEQGKTSTPTSRPTFKLRVV